LGVLADSWHKSMEGKVLSMEMLQKNDIYQEIKNGHEEFSRAGGLAADLKKLEHYNNLAQNMHSDRLPFDFTTFVLLQRYLIRKGEFLTAYHIAKSMILSLEEGNLAQRIPEKYYIWKEIFAGNTEKALEKCETFQKHINVNF